MGSEGIGFAGDTALVERRYPQRDVGAVALVKEGAVYWIDRMNIRATLLRGCSREKVMASCVRRFQWADSCRMAGQSRRSPCGKKKESG